MLVREAVESRGLLRPARRLSAAGRELALRARAELAVAPERATSLGELSKRLGTSAYHLCRCFHGEHGRTLHAHRTALRLAASLEPLSAPGLDLSALAHQLGFASHSHFSAAFRRAFGVSPSRARRELAERGRAGYVRLTESAGLGRLQPESPFARLGQRPGALPPSFGPEGRHALQARWAAKPGPGPRVR